jgi:peptide/nickel transport system permease protein
MALFLRKFFRKPGNWIALSLAAVLIGVALAGSHLAPHDPLGVELSLKFKPPSAQFWMGTDNLGRDVASRVIAGAILALQSAAVILASASLIGVVVGLVSGFYGGLVDEIFMRLSDILIAFPGLVLALAIAAALGPNLTNAMIAISLVWWPPYARLVRGQVLSMKQRDFILALHSLGASNTRIMFAHILPNVITPLIVQVTSDLGPALITTSSLSFIGMGAQPPTPEWGSMVSQGRKYILDYWWISTFPGAAILVTVLIFNAVGERLRQTFQM